jgi:prepilin-type N-terminal cleavage/methylation domain-containing protein
MTPRHECRLAPSLRGVSLTEMLTVVALLAVLAGVMVPSLAPHDGTRLEVAAAEVRDALRFARAEALRRGKPALLDAETTPGKLKVIWLSANCNGLSSFTAATDPRSKVAFAANVTGGAFSAGVVVTPRFLAGGTAYGGLVFDAHGKPSEACVVSSKTSKGAPEAGSNVLLTLGDRQATVSVDGVTGRVSGP